jgi:hypothetical protein
MTYYNYYYYSYHYYYYYGMTATFRAVASVLLLHISPFSANVFKEKYNQEYTTTGRQAARATLYRDAQYLWGFSVELVSYHHSGALNFEAALILLHY